MGGRVVSVRGVHVVQTRKVEYPQIPEALREVEGPLISMAFRCVCYTRVDFLMVAAGATAECRWCHRVYSLGVTVTVQEP